MEARRDRDGLQRKLDAQIDYAIELAEQISVLHNSSTERVLRDAIITDKEEIQKWREEAAKWEKKYGDMRSQRGDVILQRDEQRKKYNILWDQLRKTEEQLKKTQEFWVNLGNGAIKGSVGFKCDKAVLALDAETFETQKGVD
jgi:hypothetical protein